jgi:hypothetical protein
VSATRLPHFPGLLLDCKSPFWSICDRLLRVAGRACDLGESQIVPWKGRLPQGVRGTAARRKPEIRSTKSETNPDRARAAGALVLVGGLMIFDGGLSRELEERRSAFADRISRATTGFGSGDSLLIAGGLIGRFS